MPEHNTYFKPTAVVHTDLVTGERTIEVDFGNSLDRSTDWFEIDSKRSQDDADYLDKFFETPNVETGYYEVVDVGIMRIHSLDFTS